MLKLSVKSQFNQFRIILAPLDRNRKAHESYEKKEKLKLKIENERKQNIKQTPVKSTPLKDSNESKLIKD
jgi:hypothetical protein